MRVPSNNATTKRGRRLCELLGIERPVLLAPMAGVAGGALAAAVTSAGGLGVLGGGYGDIEWIDRQVQMCAGARFGVGLITWALRPGVLDAVLAHHPVAVWLSYGDPGPHVAAVHAARAVLICQVGTVAEAVAAGDAGADVLVAQGREAGGHGRLETPLLELTAAIHTAVPDVLSVAAGGIADRNGFDAARAHGAAGVAVGTALYATVEAIDVDAAKRRLVDGQGSDTVRSTVYDHVRGPLWPAGYTGRSLRTTLTDGWAGREQELAEKPEVRLRYLEAAEVADMSVRVVWAGEGLDLIDRVRPAAEIVERFPRLRGKP